MSLVLISLAIFYLSIREHVLDVRYVEASYIAILVSAILGLFLETGSFYIHYVVESLLFFFLAMYNVSFIILSDSDLFGFIMLIVYIVYIVASLLMSAKYCAHSSSYYGKPPYSWSDLLTVLKDIWRAGEKIVIRSLEKALSYAIFIGPLSIIISYLLIKLGIISAQAEFGEFARSIFNILILAVFFAYIVYIKIYVFFKKKSKDIKKALQVEYKLFYVLYIIVIVMLVAFAIPAYNIMVILETGKSIYPQEKETYGYALRAFLLLIFSITNMVALKCALKRDKI